MSEDADNNTETPIEGKEAPTVSGANQATGDGAKIAIQAEGKTIAEYLIADQQGSFITHLIKIFCWISIFEFIFNLAVGIFPVSFYTIMLVKL